MTASELKEAVLARYRSVYAFCRAHPEIKRATVYLVLSGRYPGKWNEQAAKIQADAARQNSPGECVITSGTSDCTRCKKIAKAGHVPAFFTV